MRCVHEFLTPLRTTQPQESRSSSTENRFPFSRTVNTWRIHGIVLIPCQSVFYRAGWRMARESVHTSCVNGVHASSRSLISNPVYELCSNSNLALA